MVAAHLGWARSQSWDLSAVRRTTEGADLVALALQIDPECAIAWRYCGELATGRGDTQEASRCFAEAVRVR